MKNSVNYQNQKGWCLLALIVILGSGFSSLSLKAATPKDTLSKREQISLYKNPDKREFLYSKTFPADSFPPCEEVKSDRNRTSFNQSLNRIDWVRLNAGLIARDLIMNGISIGETGIIEAEEVYGKQISFIKGEMISTGIILEVCILQYNVGIFSNKNNARNNTSRYFFVDFTNPNQAKVWALPKSEHTKLKSR